MTLQELIHSLRNLENGCGGDITKEESAKQYIREYLSS